MCYCVSVTDAVWGTLCVTVLVFLLQCWTHCNCYSVGHTVCYCCSVGYTVCYCGSVGHTVLVLL